MTSIRSYLLGTSYDVVATTISSLEKRSTMHLEKRYEVCSTNPTRYCDDGWYCTSSYTCRKKANYAWIAGVAALVILLGVLSCWRRMRNRNAMQAQQTVVTVVDNPQPPTGAYGGNYAPPAGDPNMAYQTPVTYPPVAPAPYGVPPAGAYPAPGQYPPTSGYAEKPIGSTYPTPTDAPAPYSVYPPASGSFSPAVYPAPSSSSPYPPPTSPAPAYPSPAPAYPSPAPAPFPSPAPAPYPVPQGEAATFAPPPPK